MIYCNDGIHCDISCESSFAGYNTTIICQNNANCSVNVVNVDDIDCNQTQAFWCPTVIFNQSDTGIYLSVIPAYINPCVVC